MSLQSCPVCGYALSTETLKCRHCLASHDGSSASYAAAWFNKYGIKIITIAFSAFAVGFGVYYIIHFQKGGAF
jgi:hypothetical protein